MGVVNLTSDETDEILYLTRVNERAELATYLSDLSCTHQCDRASIIAAAVEDESRNTALHYAAANGHIGRKLFYYFIFFLFFFEKSCNRFSFKTNMHLIIITISISFFFFFLFFFSLCRVSEVYMLNGKIKESSRK